MNNTGLEKAIGTGDIGEVRLGFVNCFMVSSDWAKKCLEFYRNQISQDLWQAHNGKTFKNKSGWNKEYFVALQMELQDNFSEERFAHTIEVGQYVMRQKQAPAIDKPKPNAPNANAAKQKSQEAKQESQQANSSRIVATVVVVGVIVAIAAIAFL